MAPVVAYIESRRGELVTLDEIMDHIGGDVPTGSVQRLMLDLTRRDLGLEVINQGRVWRLSPLNSNGNPAVSAPVKRTAPPTPPAKLAAAVRAAVTGETEPKPGAVFECVGSTREGVVLRDESGCLWAARRM